MIKNGLLKYGPQEISYEIRYLASRQTLGIEVHPDGRVLVRAPEGCTGSFIAERVSKRARWISRQLAQFDHYRPRTPARQHVNGESHLYLGRHYRLRVSVNKRASVKLLGGHLLVEVPEEPTPERVKAILHHWYLERARVIFGEILDASLIPFKGIARPRLIVRSMRSRWGSLSRAGNMTLNVSLVRAPRSCIEYVVTHELCHLMHRDHDGRFFQLLRRVMPDWEHRKERLERSLI